eukprot:6205441-Pleurochrysis_carterae.AAC.2
MDGRVSKLRRITGCDEHERDGEGHAQLDQHEGGGRRGVHLARCKPTDDPHLRACTTRQWRERG